MPLQATSGAASYDAFGGGVPVVPAYIEEVFQTWLYSGNSSTQTITNGIDLSTKGGLVWIKDRTTGSSLRHQLYDTARGVTKSLQSNATDAEETYANGLTSFGTTGFSLGDFIRCNATGYNYASWTFRKQPKFFDVVTYTGTASAQNIAHNLGSTPACIIVKKLNDTSIWPVYHSSLGGADKYLRLNATDAVGSASSLWDNTAPTGTQFTVGTSGSTNGSGNTFVAYLFASNAGGFGLTGTDNVISCGSYAGTGSPVTVTLGYEPQWVMIKEASGSGNDWLMFDNMRGMPVGSNDAVLRANTSGAEGGGEYISPTATGFILGTAPAGINDSGFTYIYIAIRRGPMKVPTSGTSVFAPVTYTGDNSNTRVISTGFPPDMIWTDTRSNSSRRVGDRLRGLFVNPGPDNFTHSSSDEQLDSYSLPQMSGWQTGNGTVRFENSTSVNYVFHAFKRAPSFFDVCCYTGTGTQQNISHNLGAVPQLIFVKSRSAANGGLVYNATITASKYLKLFFTGEGDFAAVSDVGGFAGVTPTSSVFTVGTYNNVNGSGVTYVAYLFATCAGVSKVGSYTGTGTTLQIDCGFTGGARFVLIKRTDSTGDWYLWDSARGIVAGDDPYLLINTQAAEVTNTDYVDTYSAGFEITSTAPAAINASAGTFIFLAIA
jgi:hypothetical protein